MTQIQNSGFMPLVRKSRSAEDTELWKPYDGELPICRRIQDIDRPFA